MSEPTFICSAPELANQAQKVALYSHYAAAAAGFGAGAVLLARSRAQEKVPHILGAVAAFGVGLAALYSQWEYNQFLYMYRETAATAVALRSGVWFLWATLLFVGLSLTPGFRFKRMKKLALIPLIACAFFAFGAASAGDVMSAAAMTVTPSVQALSQIEGSAGDALDAFRGIQQAAASGFALMCGVPALVFALLLGGSFVISQAKKVEKRSEENHQMRTGVMTLVAVLIPALVYGGSPFLIASGEHGIARAVLLFNCGDVMSMFFLLCATMSLLGVPANFPKPPKPAKEKKAEKNTTPPVPADAEHPTVLDQQQAYAQAYAQQLYAQQQAYAQYYAQQQQAAAQQQQTTAAAQPGVVPAQTPAQPAPEQQTAAAGAVDPAAAAAYQQQQAQYYAQQQAYAAYQQQQQAYQQGVVPQQQYAQPQQQVYAQAYAQQQTAYRQQHRPAPTGTVRHVKPVAAGGVKRVGGVRPIKKVR